MYTLQIQHTCEHSDSGSLHHILLTPCCLRLIDFHHKCTDPLAEQVEAERTGRSVSANRLTKSVVQVALVRSSLIGTERHRVDDAKSKSLWSRSQSQVAVARSFCEGTHVNHALERTEDSGNRAEEDAFQKAGLADDDLQQILVDDDKLQSC